MLWNDDENYILGGQNFHNLLSRVRKIVVVAVWLLKDPYFYADSKDVNLPRCQIAPKKIICEQPSISGTCSFFQKTSFKQ
jgi:hypothetical protein